VTQGTIFTVFKEVAEAQPDAIALIRRDTPVSYADLFAGVMQCAAQLRRCAAGPGAVAIQTRDERRFLEVFLACAAIGKPALPLDHDLPRRGLEALVETHPIAAIVADAVPETLPQNVAVIDGHSYAGARHHDFDLDPAPDHTAEFYWGMTSGTTGAPKLFARSHASWTASFDAAESVFGFPAGSRILIPGPLQHSLFLFGALHALCRGHTVIIPGGTFNPKRIAAALDRATHLYAVPFMLNELLKAGAQAEGLRTVFSGGAKLEPQSRKAVDQAWPGVDLVEFYGASETSFISFHSTKQPASAESVGRLFPGVLIEIRSEAGQTLPAGEVGEIFVSSPMLFSRYVGEEPAERWVSVGDRGFVDADDCLFLTGRANRTIKSKGIKIQPEPIEAVLAELPEIKGVAVVDLPDEVRGAVPAAAIAFATPAGLDRRTLSAHCRTRLNRHHNPRRFFVAEKLPLTPSGKIAVAEIREALIAGHSAYRELT